MEDTKPKTRTEYEIISIHQHQGCVVNEQRFKDGQQVGKSQWAANDLEEVFQAIAEGEGDNFTVSHCSGSVEFVKFSEIVEQ